MMKVASYMNNRMFSAPPDAVLMGEEIRAPLISNRTIGIVLKLAMAISLLSGLCTGEMGGKRREKNQYTWDLQSLYSTQQAWEQEVQFIVTHLRSIHELKGTLGNSPDSLAEGLDQISNLRARVMK